MASQSTEVLSLPSPEFTPLQAVQMVIRALQYTKDCPTTGFSAAFEFASPANRSFMGTIAYFRELMATPHYQPLIDYERADFSAPLIIADVAQVRVRLFHPAQRAIFTFLLSQQTTSPCAGCWLIDSIIRDF